MTQLLARRPSNVTPVVIALILAAGAVACRSPVRKEKRAAVTGGVGFELPEDARVARGAIVTQPSGREEAFLAFVAGGSSHWAEACRAETGAPAPQFVLETDARGKLQVAPTAPGESPRERCLAAQAIATSAAGLPPGTRLVVQLSLK